MDALIAAKLRDREVLDVMHSYEDVIRDREENSEQVRALGELKDMAASYGVDLSGPAATAQQAIQWTYFGFLGSTKEQNGAAMSLGRTSTFLDVYVERDLAEGRITEERAQELVDDFVIKLRIIRFLRTPEYDELFSGDPTWVTESIGGMGRDGRTLVTRTSFRFLQTLYNLGPRRSPTSRCSGRRICRPDSSPSPPRCRSTPRAIQYENDELMRPEYGDDTPSPVACRRCRWASRCSSSARASIWPRRCSTPSTVAATRSPASRSPRSPSRWPATSWITTTVMAALDSMMDWLAKTYVNALNVIHYMHDKYTYERLEMALHDRT